MYAREHFKFILINGQLLKKLHIYQKNSSIEKVEKGWKKGTGLYAQ
jgi:hypothetical protein